ncbi:MAG: hypothetical protein RIQ93_3011 [Verrucomicrobiota bacterium]|jgi:hypothetical protein
MMLGKFYAVRFSCTASIAEFFEGLLGSDTRSERYHGDTVAGW